MRHTLTAASVHLGGVRACAGSGSATTASTAIRGFGAGADTTTGVPSPVTGASDGGGASGMSGLLLPLSIVLGVILGAIVVVVVVQRCRRTQKDRVLNDLTAERRTTLEQRANSAAVRASLPLVSAPYNCACSSVQFIPHNQCKYPSLLTWC